MLTQTTHRSDPIFRPAIPPRNAPPLAKPLHADAIKADPLDHAMHLMGAPMSYPLHAEIFGEGEPAEYIYKVISGSVRTYKILSDGRRQVSGFHLPGDVFGLEFADEHTASAEAIVDAKVLVVKRGALDALASRDAGIARRLFVLAGRELRRAQEHILLLIKNAQERVAGFLLEMADRTSGSNAIELPMPRQDIADYLGLTIETVSRTFTSLETAAAIDIATSRHIVLRNRSVLRRING